MTDRKELVRRAQDLVPALVERAFQTEQSRQIPDETIRDLKAGDLVRAAQPERFGGLGLDFDVTFDVASELGRGCGSTAWCYSIWASHNWIVGMFSERAQKEYWGGSLDALACTSLNPFRGTAAATAGGYTVAGQWDFASGCDAAGWILIVTTSPDGPLMLMVPKTDYTIIDTWFTSGLRGSGSKDVFIDNVFVPEHRALSMQDMREAQTPGRKLYDTPNYRIPMRNILSFALSSPIIGMAKGAIEAFESVIMEGRSSRTGARLVEAPGLQMRLAEAAALVRTAESMMWRDCAEMYERARLSGMPTLEERARYRRDQAFTSKLCVQAVNLLFEASGGRAIVESSPLQRFHRDIHTASHHVSLSWDTTAAQYGAVRLGVATENLDL